MRSSQRLKVWGVAVVLAVGTGAAISAASPGQATGGDKTYAVTSTASVAAGLDTTLTVTLANTSRQWSFGSAQVPVPAGLTLRGTPTINRAGNVALLNNGSVIELSNMNVGRNTSVVLSVPVRIPCGAGGPFAWNSAVKQSNEFNGTGNDFVNAGNPAVPVTTVSGQCRLVFAGQPADTVPGRTITTVRFDANGAPVRVEVRDGRTTGSAVVSSFTGNVALGVSGGSPTATLTGGAARAAVAGVVTFSPSIGTASATPYTLVASSTGFTSQSSASFVVGFGATASCTQLDTQTCTTGNFPSPNGNTANITVNDGDRVTGTIVAQYDGSTFECPGYDATSDTLVFDFFIVSTAPGSGALTKTITLSQPAVAGKPLASDYQVCFEAPYDFAAYRPAELEDDFALFDFSGNTYTSTGPSGTLYRGLLLPCDATAGATPCVVSRTLSGGVATISFKVEAGDPGGRF